MRWLRFLILSIERKVILLWAFEILQNTFYQNLSTNRLAYSRLVVRVNHIIFIYLKITLFRLGFDSNCYYYWPQSIELCPQKIKIQLSAYSCSWHHASCSSEDWISFRISGKTRIFITCEFQNMNMSACIYLSNENRMKILYCSFIDNIKVILDCIVQKIIILSVVSM